VNKLPTIQWMIIPGLTLAAHLAALAYATAAFLYGSTPWVAYVLFVVLSSLALASAGLVIHFRACLVRMAGEIHVLGTTNRTQRLALNERHLNP
jgi:hypothetical protein